MRPFRKGRALASVEEHLPTTSLLELRDGARPPAGAAAHLEGCARCQQRLAELSALREALGNLPREAASEPLWDGVRSRLHSERRPKRSRRVGMVLRLAAALLVAFLAVGAWEARREWREGAPLRAQVRELEHASRLLEAHLVAWRPNGRVMAGWRSEAVVRVEDELSALDQALAHVARAGVGAARSLDLRRHLLQQRLRSQGQLIRLHRAAVDLTVSPSLTPNEFEETTFQEIGHDPNPR